LEPPARHPVVGVHLPHRHHVPRPQPLADGPRQPKVPQLGLELDVLHPLRGLPPPPSRPFHPRALSRAASSHTGTPRALALSSFDPASAPAITRSVFELTDP